ncbi:hypothetical protein [Thermococcus sp. P6]|uniref:hypothetical protein n=1 Tax=Thermococcus sp. P6 TaxID=122420 RepID=UPI0012FD7875|nr:hypothetical protein [Thermococcus sp. P6]
MRIKVLKMKQILQKDFEDEYQKGPRMELNVLSNFKENLVLSIIDFWTRTRVSRQRYGV